MANDRIRVLRMETLSLSLMECGYRNWRSSTQTVSQRHLADIVAGNFFFFIGFPRKQAPSEESDKGRSNLTDEDGGGWPQWLFSKQLLYDFT